jgi:alkylation response protein AidB-like acyl-CoA dehydrogenase
MDFSLTDTQREIARSARAWLAQTYPAHRVSAIADGEGIDVGSWGELVRQGWLDPDLGFVELALLALESGYALAPTPWLATVAVPGFEPRPSALVTGDFTAEGQLVSGQGEPAFTAGAQRLVVLVGEALFTVEADAAGVTVQELESFDRLRRASRVRLDRVEATPLTGTNGSWRERAAVLYACEAVGVAERALDFAVDYAKIREQFGKPIGTFQAVAHQLADAYVELELARSLAYRAAWVTGASGPDPVTAAAAGEPNAVAWVTGAGEPHPVACAAARAACRQAALRCAETALQVLGGIGATWEHPLHLWLRRAWWHCEEISGADAHELIAAALLDADRSHGTVEQATVV